LTLNSEPYRISLLENEGREKARGTMRGASSQRRGKREDEHLSPSSLRGERMRKMIIFTLASPLK